MKSITKAELLIWSAVILAMICIITLCVTREKIIVAMPEPVVKGRESMKKPGTMEMSRLRHEPKRGEIQEVKKVGGDESLKKED